MDLADLIEKARELAPADRIKLANDLLDSVEQAVESDPGVDDAWQAEFPRRIDDIESGRLLLVDGRETMRLVRERIAERRAQQSA